MKLKVSASERAHVMNIIKLCYIMITLSALFVLKIIVHPESIQQILISPHEIDFMLESIFHATGITTAGNVLAIRLL